MSIFISYSRKDQAYVNKLVKALEREGLPVWLDDRVDYGDTWPRVIEENLTKSQVFLLVMSPRSKNSHYVNCELALALELKKPIFPLLLEGSRWLEVGIIQTVDIQGGKLPPDIFFNKVRSKLGINDLPDHKDLSKNSLARRIKSKLGINDLQDFQDRMDLRKNSLELRIKEELNNGNFNVVHVLYADNDETEE